MAFDRPGPTGTAQVELFHGNLFSRDQNGDPCSHILVPHRDERRVIGFWDGERWCGMETGEDCFDLQRTNEQLPPHWRALPPLPRLWR